MKFNSILLASLLLAVCNMPLSAQEGDGGDDGGGRFNTWSAGLTLGHITGFTDLKQKDYFPAGGKPGNENRFGVGLNINKALTNAFGLRGWFMFGGLQGKKEGAEAPDGSHPYGLYYNTNLMSYGAKFIFNVSALAFKPREIGKQRKTALYFFAGHGIVSFDTEVKRLIDGNEQLFVDWHNRPDEFKDQKGVSGKTNEAVNPIGIGFKYKLNDQFDAALELNINRVNSDKLDAWAQGAAPDYYSYTAINIIYKFGKHGTESESLEWVNPMEVMYNGIQENRQRINTLATDDDGDGVSNLFDKGPETPEGIIVDGSGVPLDGDRDGIFDSEDEDPFTDIGAKVDEKGKAIDSDGDGVADSRDLEPNTDPGALVNFQGKSIGKLPKGLSGGIAGGGGGGGAYFPSVYFDFGGRKIKASNYDRLATIARALKFNEGVILVLTGHTDDVGSDDYNMKLGEQRAQAVSDHLSKYYEIAADRMKVGSKGKSEPHAKGLNHINRRVDISME